MPVQSKVPDVHIPENVDIWSYVQIKAAKFMDRDALVDSSSGKILTYSEFFNKVCKVKHGLSQLGMSKGDTLLIFAQTSIELFVLSMAVTALGGVMATCNNQYTKEELLETFQVTRPVYAAVSMDLLQKMEEVQAECGLLRHIITLDGGKDGSIPISQLANVTEYDKPAISIVPKEDVAWIFYSSGTTGKPKGVMMTHFGIVGNQLQTSNPAISMDTNEDPGAYIAFVPFYNIFTTWLSLTAFTAGKTLVLMPKFSFPQYLELVATHKCQTLFLVPPVATLLAKDPKVDEYDLSHVRRIFCGAASCGGDVEAAIKRRIPGTSLIKQGYGMTETGPIISTIPNKAPKQGSVGIAIANTEIKIVDDVTKLEVETNKDGEVWVRGPQLMKGYLNNPQATAETIDSEGWLHTGDMGHLDEDGYLFITGRLKEIIMYDAMQVPPASLEDILLTHEAVADAAVIGIPDTYAGELPKAFVVLKQGYSAEPKEIQTYVANRVADFKQLRGGVEIRAKIPKSASGKILRRILIQEGKQRLATIKP